MKKLLAFTVSTLLTMSLAACGGSDTSSSPAAASGTSSPASAAAADNGDFPVTSKTQAFFAPFLDSGTFSIDLSTSFVMDGAESVISVFLAVDGAQAYMSGEEAAADTSFEMILNEEAMYVLDPTSKMALKMSLADMGEEMGAADFAEMNIAAAVRDDWDIYTTPVETGTIDMDGKSYDYEDFTVDGVTTTYCFEGDKVVYIIEGEGDSKTTVQLKSMSTDVGAAKFEVPSDYEVMDMSALASMAG